MAKTQGDFSLKRFIEDNSKGGFIFVTSYAEIEATLKPVFSLMVSFWEGDYCPSQTIITEGFFLFSTNLERSKDYRQSKNYLLCPVLKGDLYGFQFRM